VCRYHGGNAPQVLAAADPAAARLLDIVRNKKSRDGDAIRKACDLAGIERLPLYTFRHTCLTRWSSHMDPYALAYFAGHSDFGTTRRYVHPNMETGRAAMEKAREVQGGYNSGYSAEKTSANVKLRQ
jgi:integrase